MGNDLVKGGLQMGQTPGKSPAKESQKDSLMTKAKTPGGSVNKCLMRLAEFS